MAEIEQEDIEATGNKNSISEQGRVALLKETRSGLTFFALLILVVPAGILGVTALLPAPQRIFGLLSLMLFLLMVIGVTLFFAIKYPVVFLGYNHPLIVRRRLHGPPTPGLHVFAKPPSDKEIFRSEGVVLWSEQMDSYVGKLAIITAIDNVSRTARLDIDNGENPWAWEWLDFVELPKPSS